MQLLLIAGILFLALSAISNINMVGIQKNHIDGVISASWKVLTPLEA